MSGNVSLDLIKKLREQTLVGMADCKKALEEAQGDFAKAIELLRKKGMSVAAKRSANATENGIIYGKVSSDFHRATLVQMGCETDFSARTDSMKEFVATLADEIIDNQHAAMSSVEILDVLVKKTSMDVKSMLADLISKIAENIVVSKVEVKNTSANSLVNVYVHPDGTIGSLIELKTSAPVADAKAREELSQLAKTLCMQIAVTSPVAVSSTDLDADLVAKEREIAKATLDTTGKPENIVAKMLEGKIAKFFKEVCLAEQPFIKDEAMAVKDYLAAFSKKAGYEVSIVGFTRFGIKR